MDSFVDNVLLGSWNRYEIDVRKNQTTCANMRLIRQWQLKIYNDGAQTCLLLNGWLGVDEQIVKKHDLDVVAFGNLLVGNHHKLYRVAFDKAPSFFHQK